MKYIIELMRKRAEEAINAKGMRAGLPKVRVDAGQLQGLCDRADRILEENERLREENEKLRRCVTVRNANGCADEVLVEDIFGEMVPLSKFFDKVEPLEEVLKKADEV